MTKSLKEKTTKGILWTLIDRFGGQVVLVVMSIFLMRLLDPSVYGLMGMVMVFYGFSEVLIDGGFGAALIQKKEITEEDYSTVFWFNIAIGILLFGLGYFLAPLIAVFFEKPELTSLARYLSISFLFSSLNIVQRIQLQKELNFKSLSIINLASLFTSQLIAIVLAIKGFDVISLVMAQLLNIGIASILLWFSSAWRPKLIFSLKALNSLWVFSAYMFGHRVLNYCFGKLDVLLIGKFIGEASLGLYRNSKKLIFFTIQSLATAISSVLFPSMSKLQDDQTRSNELYLFGLSAITLLLFPIVGFISGSAPVLINFVFGEKWMGMVFFVQIFALIALFSCVNIINNSFILARGHSGFVMKFGLVTKSTRTIIMLGLGFYFGAKGIVIAILVNSILFFAIKQIAVAKKLNLNFRKIFITIFPNFLIGLLVSLFCYTFIQYSNLNGLDYATVLFIPSLLVLIFILILLLNKSTFFRLVNLAKTLI